MNLARYFGLEDLGKNFPVVTFLIATTCLVIFLFTYKDLVYYQNLLGYVPASPRIHSLITYSFLHANIPHLLANLIMLILLGLVLENSIDYFSYTLVYLTSGVVSAVFDTLSRSVFSINASLPFIGASGAIFGLAGVAILIKPYEKLPSALVVLFVIPLIMLAINSPQIIENPFILLLTFMFIGLLSVLVLFQIPSLPTIAVFFYYTIFTLTFMVIEGFAGNISYIGHLGGLLGGIISFFLFCRKSDK